MKNNNIYDVEHEMGEVSRRHVSTVKGVQALQQCNTDRCHKIKLFLFNKSVYAVP
ncbi:MAG: hypothetical protein OEL81_02970 [Nitrosopumilus sp.]|nr:hypothetical protein [Nitrosopumilus sp.]